MRRSLAVLPELVVPEPYTLLTLERDDITAWAALLGQNGEFGEWSVEQATPYFGPDSHMPLAGSFFLTQHGEPVATAQLHLNPDGPYTPVPELGWVAVSLAHRGHRLGSVVSLAVLHYAASTGHREVFLQTDDHRVAAIKMYLRLGFEPWMHDPTAPERWRAVLAVVAQTDHNARPQS